MSSQTIARRLTRTFLWFLPIFIMSEAKGQSFDYVISACDVQIQPSNELLISITLDVEAPKAVFGEPGSQFFVPVRYLFDGQPVVADQLREIISGRLAGNNCPAENADHTCDAPAGGPCGKTWYRDKDNNLISQDWDCLHNFNTHNCDCVKPGAPVIHKLIAPPTTSGTFSFVLDPDNQDAETDETNNTCSVPYTADLIPTLNEWGLIAMALLLLAGGAVVSGRRRVDV